MVYSLLKKQHLIQRQRKPEGAAFTQLAFHANFAIVQFYDLGTYV
jgi:hypothetical protein